MSLYVTQIPVGGFDKNFSYIIADDVTREAYVVDPTGEFAPMIAELQKHEYHVIGILLTHTHFDHIEQVSAVLGHYPVPIHIHRVGKIELDTYEDVRTLNEGDTLQLGAGLIHVLHTPGHTDDSVCFYIPADNAVDEIPKAITGDTLFVGGCGRTTQTQVKDLYQSLADLAALPDETVIYPGHDYGDTPTSTIGHEKATNRFYKTKSFAAFKTERLG